MAGSILDAGRLVAAGLVAALLPSPERERVESLSRTDVDTAVFSLLIGALEAPLGVLLFMAGGIAYADGSSVAGSMLLLENWWDGLRSYHLQAVGMISWLAWLLHPLAWASASIAITGGVRLAAFAATREPVAEPGLALVLFVRRALGSLCSRARERVRLGPERPDRIVRRSADELVLFTPTPRAEWNELVTIEIGGRFYRLTDARKVRDGRWSAWAYRLREERSSNVIRRLVRYG
jgi:hypothetical protein